MNLPQLYNRVGAWLEGAGPEADVVISSRIRLARNIAGHFFHSRADNTERQEVLDLVHNKVMVTDSKENLWYVGLDDTSELERQLLTERQLISKQLAEGEGPRGLILAHDESLALMINEEDHVRFQVLSSGLQLSEMYERISRVDDALSAEAAYAFSDEYGYLTACPTNVGTGVRVSVMLHLPGLKMTGEIDKVLRAAKDVHLAVRGLYGEGTEPAGDFYQLSNQVTLGRSEGQIIDELVAQAVAPVVEYERRARQALLQKRSVALDDRVFRALGVLRNARMVSSEETMYMLSYIRLGIHLGLIKDITVRTVNELFLLTQPAHLQNFFGEELDAMGRDQARAKFIRQRIC